MPRHPIHDYRRPAVYHITLRKAPGVSDFSIITGRPESCYLHHNPVGVAIEKSIRTMRTINPAVQPYQYKIMPDHVHILLKVLEAMKDPVGIDIAKMKIRALHSAREKGFRFDSLFEPDFYDRILRPWHTLDSVYQYIRQNPYRLQVRKYNPDFFRRLNFVFNYGGIIWQAYGNLQLLENPFKEPVICHRADAGSSKEAALIQNWLHTVSNGGVLVSQFISKKEKEVRKMADEANGKVILIVNEPFGKIYKPGGRNFELCEQGRLLILAPTQSLPSIKPTFLFLNGMAEYLCGQRIL